MRGLILVVSRVVKDNQWRGVSIRRAGIIPLWPRSACTTSASVRIVTPSFIPSHMNQFLAPNFLMTSIFLRKSQRLVNSSWETRLKRTECTSNSQVNRPSMLCPAKTSSTAKSRWSLTRNQPSPILLILLIALAFNPIQLGCVWAWYASIGNEWFNSLPRRRSHVRLNHGSASQHRYNFFL